MITTPWSRRPTPALDAWPHLRYGDAAMRATREDLSSALRMIVSAVIVDHTAIVTEYVTWFESVLAARDLPLTFVPTAFTLLLDVLPPELPNARVMTVAGLQACTAPAAQGRDPGARLVGGRDDGV